MQQKIIFITKKISAIYRLVRFEHAIMFALSVFIGEIIANANLMFTQTIFFSLLIPIFSEMGAFALNDFLDVKSDRINKKTERPLVSGELSVRFALFLSIISFVLAISFAYLVSPLIFILTIAINLLAILYNFVLKDIALIGNSYIAFTMAIPFVFGNYVVSDTLSLINVLIAVLGFIVGLGREIAKTVEDIEGDKKARMSKTLPMLIGSEKSLVFAGLLYVLFIIISIIVYYLYLKISFGFVFVLIADIILLYLALVFIFSKNRMRSLKFARKMSLLALAFALIGIVSYVLGY